MLGRIYPIKRSIKRESIVIFPMTFHPSLRILLFGLKRYPSQYSCTQPAINRPLPKSLRIPRITKEPWRTNRYKLPLP